MGIVRAHVLFSGRVQGVYFRAHTEKKATSLGLKGWVKNLPDGRVEAAFEGPRNLVEEAIHFCSKEQPLAKVDQVDTQWEEPSGEEDFSVRR